MNTKGTLLMPSGKVTAILGGPLIAAFQRGRFITGIVPEERKRENTGEEEKEEEQAEEEGEEEDGLMAETRNVLAIPVMEPTGRHYNNRKCETTPACRSTSRRRTYEFLYGNKNHGIGPFADYPLNSQSLRSRELRFCH